MNRRQMLSATAAAAASRNLAAAPAKAPAAGKRALMTVGCQTGPTSDERLQFFKRHGVEHICGYPDDSGQKGYYSTEDVAQLRERCEKHGVKLAMIALPFLASSHIDKTPRPAIMLGQSPERDRDIEHVQNTIRSCAAAGVPSIKYNMSLLGVLSTEPTQGRGGIIQRSWNLAEAKASGKFPPLTKAGRVPASVYWERITYFLDRVVPTANEHKVRLACHPHDPGVPPGEGFQGIDAVLGTVDGLKRFVSIRESPYHGLNFCQGTISEMLQDPAREILDVIRYFGSRGKIFNVHFRNIRGKRDQFQETYPDDGDVDFVKALLAYKEVGYSGMMMPDHMPRHAGDPNGLQAFAFAYGYIKALIQAANAMG